MRVENDYLNKGLDLDRSTISHDNTQVSKDNAVGAFSLDILSSVSDNKAYGSKGRTTEDIVMEAGQSNTDLQRDYMIIMSNSLSEEDFAKLLKDGFNPNNMEIETLVTVTDKIKAELMQAGVQINGYTDDISMEKLNEITGSQSMAQEIAGKLSERDVPVTEGNVEAVKHAIDKTEKLSELSDGVLKYMVQTKKEPTIDNLYKAQFSALADGSRQGKGYYADEMPGYYAKKAENYDWEQLNSQIEKVITDAGKEVTEETKENAKWLIEKGIPLTGESLNLLDRLKGVLLKQDRNTMIAKIARAMGEGKTAGDTSLTAGDTIYKKAADILADVEQISEDAVLAVAKRGDTFTIKELLAAQNHILSGYTSESLVNSKTVTAADREPAAYEGEKIHISAATAKRQLEEIRLQMSFEANVKLLKSGFSIDTAELEQVVDALKKAEKEQNSVLFGSKGAEDTEVKASLYKDVINKVKDIASMPAAVLGKAVTEGTVFTLNYVHREGGILQSAYRAAGQTYEALITAPRSDLGDSIKKAFRNVDDLLKETGLTPTENSRRSVRILGYNNMPVTEENVTAVMDADESLNRVLRKMTPAAAIEMIRGSIDPLAMNMKDLENYLSNMEESVLQETEKYSKYLYKLEKNNAVTEEEREAYIGVYKLFRQIEKSDGAVIGSLVNQGAELTLKNLLSAVRTQKQKGMNVTVDNESGIHKTYYHENLVKDILDHISPLKLSAGNINAETELEVLAEQLQADGGDAEDGLSRQYRHEQLEDMRNLQEVEDYVIEALTDFDQPVTIDNLLAADYLTNKRGSTYKELHAKAREADKSKPGGSTAKSEEALEEAINRMQTDFTEKECAQEAYQNMKTVAEELLNTTASADKPVLVDIKSMALTFKQISLAADFAQEENYEIPVKIGREMTSINLRILHGSEDTGKVTATMRTEEYGEAAAEFSVENGCISGFIASDRQEGVEGLRQIETKFARALEKDGKTIKSLNFIYSKDLNIHNFSKDAEKTINKHKVSSKELYNVAKNFIYSLQNSESSR